MREKNRIVSNGTKTLTLLLMCLSSINVNAESLCGHKRINDPSGAKMFVGCDNGRLRSINIIGENHWKHWVFVGEMINKNTADDKEFIISEAYSVSYWHKAAALANNFVENNTVLDVDTMFFQEERKVFLRIRKSPRDTILQLREPLVWEKGSSCFVELYKNIKIARAQKSEVFTDDSIKVPDITISRGAWMTRIMAAAIKDFHAGLINHEFTAQFVDTTSCTRRRYGQVCKYVPYQYKFRIP